MLLLPESIKLTTNSNCLKEEIFSHQCISNHFKIIQIHLGIDSYFLIMYALVDYVVVAIFVRSGEKEH